jgi:hypothetical protein
MADYSDSAPQSDQTSGQDGASDIKKRADFVTYWLGQLKAYDDEFTEWTKRGKKIIRRYRDERQEKSDGSTLAGSRFNALWSNVQTLLPAIYIKPPKPVVERRYLDKDPLARVSAMTLERATEVQIEVGKFHPATRMAVLDYLLVGRGVLWERYEPTYGTPEDVSGKPLEDESTDAKEDAGQAPRPVTYEKVCTDYVNWERFKHSPAATWDEVWWVAKEEMMTRKALRVRFKGKDSETGKPIADLIPLRDGGKDKESDRQKKRRQPRACVVEIWNKTEKKVIFIAPDWPTDVLETTDDPLNLESFWPCPQPLYATLSNDTLVPVPDYAEYQDQAEELDNLTNRIAALTDAIRVNGVYDASYPELKRILSEGVDNRMIGVKNYAEFASKGGLENALDFVPIKDVVEALLSLYDARDRVKADMAEITGLSDIVRGQAQGTAKTATEQRIKGQFASLRLEDRKKEVARFVCDAIRILAEIASEQFDPETLAEMTGMIPFIADEIKSEMPAQPQAQAPSPPVSPPVGVGAPGPQSAPPAAAGALPTVQAPPMVPQVDPQALIQQAAQQRFNEAVKLLKDDKMRTFRIDIETDSTIEVDRQQAKESVVEMFTAMGGFLEKAALLAQGMPELAPALGQSFLYGFRVFGAGRDVESYWEQAIDKLSQKAKNPGPKPPSPEEIKAQAEIQKQQMESQRQQEQAQIDREQAQMDLQAQQQKNAMEMQKMQAELQMQREEMQIMREKLGMELQAEQQKQAIAAQAAERDAAMDERAAQRDDQMAERQAGREEELAQKQFERDGEAGERDFELQRKTAEVKAKQAQKPKAKEPA